MNVICLIVGIPVIRSIIASVNERGDNSPIPSNKYKYKEIAMFNLHLSVEQKKREGQELEAKNNESVLNTDLYSAGYFKGYIGAEPSQPEQHSYWSGYQIGCREYWAKKLGVVIPTEF